MDNLINIKNARSRFDRLVSSEVEFIDSISYLYRLDHDKDKYYRLKKERRERLCELSFLLTFIAWEKFLEETFLNYLVLGTRKAPKMRSKIQVKDLGTASRILQPEGRTYIEWNQVEKVKQRAEIYFTEGKPFSNALSSAKQPLEDMRYIRNCCVHHSRISRDQFIKHVITRIYGARMSLSPGEFLLNTTPAGLPPSPTITVTVFSTVFEHYANVLLTTCTEIAGN